jgi:NSS family neurotransmitter:Na+ symporter
VEERFERRRAPATITACGSAFVIGMGVVFSFNIWSEWFPLAFIDRFADLDFYELVDYLTANIMMPLGGLLLALFVGWRVSPQAVAEELNIESPVFYKAWYWLLRWVAPLSIAIVFLANL